MRTTHSNASSGISTAVTAIIIIVILVVAGGVAYFYVSTTPATTVTSTMATTATTTATSTTTLTAATSTTTSKVILSGSITVVAETGYFDAAIKAMAADFMSEHPGTTVNIVTIPYGESVTDYEVAFSANASTYDMVYMGSSGFLGTTSPYLLNLFPYMNNAAYFPSSWNRTDIIPASLPPFEIGGALYALPITLDTFCLYYRPSAFNNATNQQLFQSQYGYPLPNPANTAMNVQQLVDVTSFFNGHHGFKAGIDMFTDPMDDDLFGQFDTILEIPRTMPNTTALYGPVSGEYGTLFTNDGKLLTNTSMFKNTLASFVQLIKNSEDPFVANFGTIPGYFGAGDAPLMTQYTWPLFGLSKSSIGTDWAIAPQFPGGHSIFGGVGLGIFKYTHNLPLALSFLAYLTSASESTKFMTLDGLFPFRYSNFAHAAADLNIPQQMITTILGLMASSVQCNSNLPYDPLLSTIFRGEVNGVYAGTTTLQQAANELSNYGVEAGAVLWGPQ